MRHPERPEPVQALGALVKRPKAEPTPSVIVPAESAWWAVRRTAWLLRKGAW